MPIERIDMWDPEGRIHNINKKNCGDMRNFHGWTMEPPKAIEAKPEPTRATPKVNRIGEPKDSEKASLIAHAKDLGIKADGRWSEERLLKEILVVEEK